MWPVGGVEVAVTAFLVFIHHIIVIHCFSLFFYCFFMVLNGFGMVWKGLGGFGRVWEENIESKDRYS